MFKERYKRLYDPIHADDELIEGVLRAAENRGTNAMDTVDEGGNGRNRTGGLRLRRTAAAAAAACLCIAFTVPALASNVEPVYQLLYAVSPGTAQFFMPVKRADEDNGVRMEVISAYIHDNKAEIYIGLQDVTGNRIDNTVDLFDSYAINRPFDSSASCRLVGFDEGTRTAAFLISIEEWGNQKIAGDKITFTVKEFLSGKKTFENVEVPIDLGSIEEADKTEGRVQAVSTLGGGGPDYEAAMTGGDGDVSALVPGTALEEFPVDGIELTGTGYIDGKLHIQTAVRDSLSNDNHGFFRLKDAAGNTIDSSYSFSFYNGADGKERTDYTEFVFDVPREKLGEYKLFGNFFTSGMLTKGDWRVTFPLETVE